MFGGDVMSRIWFNGIELHSTYNFVVQKLESTPNIVMPAHEIQGTSGKKVFPELAYASSMEITLSGIVYDKSYAAVMQKLNELKNLFASIFGKGKLEVEFQDEEGPKRKYTYVQIDGTPFVSRPIGTRSGFLAANFTVQLVAHEHPYWIVENNSVNNITVFPVTNLKYFGSWKKELGWKIEAYTVVNLLGKYGDFETDSNGDGLADGWGGGSGSTNELVSWEFGTAQHVSVTYSSGTQHINYKFYPKINHTYFVKAFIKTATTDSSPSTVFGMTGSLSAYRAGYTTKVLWYADDFSNQWKLKYNTYTETENVDYRHFYLYVTADFADAKVGETYELWVDKFMLVDLTNMGTLPQGLKEYFGLDYWSDLATDNNITSKDGITMTGDEWLNILLPYVNSVATLGWKWGV